eukprot:5389662-Prymnesium_polylepis.1
MPHSPCLPYGTASPCRSAFRFSRGPSGDSPSATAGDGAAAGAGAGGSAATNDFHAGPFVSPSSAFHAFWSDANGAPSATEAPRSDAPRPTACSAFETACSTASPPLSRGAE